MSNPPEFYEELLNNLPFNIFTSKNDGHPNYANAALLQSLGHTLESFCTQNFYEMAEKGLLKQSLTKLARDTKKEIVTVNYAYENGRTKELLGITKPVFDENGEVKYVLSVGMGKFQDYWFQALAKLEASRVPELRQAEKEANPPLFYKSPAMKQVMEAAERIADTAAAVHISGESGVGKSAVARFLHLQSSRKEKPLVEINCASIPESLLESELFGYVGGAFTGALKGGKKGLIEMADGSTLFLDEIDSFPLHLQGKLLKVLETKQVTPIGATKPVQVDFRLITAANRDIAAMVKAHTFREDLFYRIHVLPLEIPPLRHRPEDVQLLSRCFLAEFCKQYGKVKRFTSSAYRDLAAYDWPGNVRELRNFIERTVLMSGNKTVEISSFPQLLFEQAENPEFQISKNPEFIFLSEGDLSLKHLVEAYEKQLLSHFLSRYSLTRAAEVLKLDVSTLTRKKKKYGL